MAEENPGILTLRLPGRLSAYLPTLRRRNYVATLGAGYFYTASSAVVNLLLVPVLIGTLGARTYGIWLTLTALGYWVYVGAVWLSPALIHDVGSGLARSQMRDAALATATVRRLLLGLGAVVMAAAVSIAALPAVGMLGGPLTSEIRVSLLLAGGWTAIRCLQTAWTSVLSAGLLLPFVHRTQAFTLLAAGGSSMAAVLLGGNLVAVFVCYLAAETVELFVLRARARGLLSDSGSFSKGVAASLVRRSVPYALSSVGSLLMASDILLLAALTSPIQVARYGVALKLIEALLQIIWRISDSTQPHIVEMHSKDDAAGLGRLHRSVVSISVAVGGAMAAFIFFTGHTLLELWVGPEAIPSQLAVRLLALYLFMRSVIQANLIFPYSTTRMTTMGWVLAVEGALKVGLAVLLVSEYGVHGAPLASVIALGALSMWWTPWYVTNWLRESKDQFFRDVLLRPAIPVLLVAGACALIPTTKPTLFGLATSMLFAALAFFVGIWPMLSAYRNVVDEIRT